MIKNMFKLYPLVKMNAFLHSSSAIFRHVQSPDESGSATCAAQNELRPAEKFISYYSKNKI